MNEDKEYNEIAQQIEQEVLVVEMPEEKKSFLVRLWNKTIFPDLIARKREEKQIRRQIMAEARKEALQEMKPQLKEALKQKELDKLTGKSKGDFMDKLAKGFGVGDTKGNSTDDKLRRMLGTGSQSNHPKQYDVVGMMGRPQPQRRGQMPTLGPSRSFASDDKMRQLLGIKVEKPKSKTKTKQKYKYVKVPIKKKKGKK